MVVWMPLRNNTVDLIYYFVTFVGNKLVFVFSNFLCTSVWLPYTPCCT